MPVKERKTKEQIAAAAAASTRTKKKKWTKERVKDKTENGFLPDQVAYDKMKVDLPKARVITVHTIMDKYRLRGSMAKIIIKEFHSQGVIKPVVKSSKCLVYTKA